MKIALVPLQSGWATEDRKEAGYSDAAKGINGETLQVDQGHTNAALVDAYNAPIVKMIAGEIEWDFSALGFE